MKIFMALFVLFFVTTLTAEGARPKYYYSQPNIKVQSYTNMNGDDQSRCQAEANYMASNRITGHVWGTIGNFEGVGYGPSPNCNTCTPGNNMRLTGDASAQDSSGRWYRVRSWR